MQSIEVQVEENLEESVELEQLSDAPVDTDKSCDNEESEEPNSCWRKTKFCCSSPIKYCRGMTSVESDDLSDVVTEESCWSKTKKCLCNPIESCCDKTMECVCVPFKSCWEMIQPYVSYVWDPISEFFEDYKNHFALLKFIMTNVCLSVFDVGSDINTAITFLM